VKDHRERRSFQKTNAHEPYTDQVQSRTDGQDGRHTEWVRAGMVG
jgi:hypothetical protein